MTVVSFVAILEGVVERKVKMTAVKNREANPRSEDKQKKKGKSALMPTL